MKKILFFVLLLISIVSCSQPTGYVKINERRSQLALATNGFNLPSGGTAALATGQWVKSGALYYDSTGANKGVYVYSGSAGWVRLVDTTRLFARNGLINIGGYLERGDSLTRNDTVFTTSNNYIWAISQRPSLADTGNLSVDFSRTGTSNGPGTMNLISQNLTVIGYKYIGMDPGFVRNQVENTITPAKAAAAGLLYSDGAVGFTSRTNSSGRISQWFQGVGGNGFCDSCLMIRNSGAGIDLATDNSQRIGFRGSATQGTYYGAFMANSGHLVVGSTLVDIGGKRLIVYGPAYISDSVIMSSLTAGVYNDSLLVTSGAVTKRIPQADSTYTPTLTGVTNVASSSVSGGSFHYIRVGNQVTISGVFTMTPTAGTSVTQIGISLPIASNFGVIQDATGTVCSIGSTYNVGQISGDVTNDRIQVDVISSNTSAHTVNISGMYTIK